MDDDWDGRVQRFWADVSDDDEAALTAMRHLICERPDDDAVAVYEWASVHDFVGRESTAIPLYRRALDLGLDGARRPKALVQLASSLRNVGDAGGAVKILEQMDGSETVGDAPQAFLALALFDAGRPGDALRVALGALTKTLPAYRGAVNHYAGQLPSGSVVSESGAPPHRGAITSFHEPPVPAGQSPYVPGAAPSPQVEIVDSSDIWPAWFRLHSERIQDALGWRALVIEHVGSTAVRGLPAKPIIDIDLIVADPDDEQSYVPALKRSGFELRVREPWWFGHRVLRHLDPPCHLHVFGFDSPEVIKHRLFRDWLRANAGDRQLYAATKRQAAAQARRSGEHSMQYNARKEQVIREIYHRAFVATGLINS